MIEQIPDRLERTLRQTLCPNERVFVKLKGAFKEALVCTDTRVLILKGGWMTGQIFGTDTFQCPYSMVAGAEVRVPSSDRILRTFQRAACRTRPRASGRAASKPTAAKSPELRVDQRAGCGQGNFVRRAPSSCRWLRKAPTVAGRKADKRAIRSGDRLCFSGALFFRAGNQIPL